MSSLEKALEILSVYSDTRDALGVGEVAAELAMPKSSVSRLMRAMADAGLLVQDDRRLYRPGPLAYRLGSLYERRLDTQLLMEQALSGLVDRFGLTGYVAVLDGADAVIVSVEQGRYPIRLVLEKGMRINAAVTAVGRALLARCADAELRRLCRNAVRRAETGLVLTRQQLLAEIEAIRAAGYAAVEGVTFVGFNAIGAAVAGARERQTIGFSLSYPQAILDEAARAEVARAVLEAATEVGSAAGDPYWTARRQKTDGEDKAAAPGRPSGDRPASQARTSSGGMR